MATRQRPVDRGSEIGRRTVATLTQEFDRARRDRGLSLRAVAGAAGVSAATVWRFGGGRSPNMPIVRAARLLAIVGLDLSARAYPGPLVLRDERQTGIVTAFRSELHRSLRWGVEVPLPGHGDQRRFDGMVRGDAWRYGVECETGPTDAQALAGRLAQKLRDGEVDGIVLVLPPTRHVRAFLAAAAPILAPTFPVPGRDALRRLRRGEDPGGSSIIVLPRKRDLDRVSRVEPTGARHGSGVLDSADRGQAMQQNQRDSPPGRALAHRAKQAARSPSRQPSSSPPPMGGR